VQHFLMVVSSVYEFVFQLLYVSRKDAKNAKKELLIRVE
jgi:hypothetical protein